MATDNLSSLVPLEEEPTGRLKAKFVKVAAIEYQMSGNGRRSVALHRIFLLCLVILECEAVHYTLFPTCPPFRAPLMSCSATLFPGLTLKET